MKLLVTGANGFLGRSVVSTAIRRGHTIRAQVRPTSIDIPEDWFRHPSLKIVRSDLREPRGLTRLVEGSDTVIHVAAAKSGELHEQFANTVIATENLLEAMKTTGVKHIVAISSFSVYEYHRASSWSDIDELTPLAVSPARRDTYCQTKLIQESMIREFATAADCRCVVLRPGVIFGRGNLWTARLGIRVNDRWWIRIGAFAPLPLTYVENCAEAVVLAAENVHEARELVLNVVDDDTPSLRTYMKALQRQMSPQPRILPVPWILARMLASLAWWTNKALFRGGAKLPGMLVPAQLHARCKPLQYPNATTKAMLGWQPHFSWREGLERARSKDDPAVLPRVNQTEAPIAPAHVEQTA